MTLVLFVQVVVLGLVEGLTEFLPVSSTGHLIIVGDTIGFTGDSAKTFEIFIQLGAILGVVWFYRERLAKVVRNPGQTRERRFILNLIIAFVPAAVLGLLLHPYIKAYLFNPITVAAALIAGGLVILIIERFPPRTRRDHVNAMTVRDAFMVGIAQAFSLFPGVSRAGATIMGGLLAGLSRTAATEFSFFLAIPTMCAATVYDLMQNASALNAADAWPFALGFIISFATALIVVKIFLIYVSRHTFVPFAYYRIGFGALVLWYFW